MWKNGARFGKPLIRPGPAPEMITRRKTTDYLRSLLPVREQEIARSEQTPVLPPESAQLLRTLCTLRQPRRILEIGTNVGFSAITMLQAAPQAELYTLEMNEETAAIARENLQKCGVGERAHLYIGRAEEILPYMQGQYDLIFLDGPKGQYPLFASYLLLSRQCFRLIRHSSNSNRILLLLN